MNKRNVATVLWFIAGWSLGGIVTGLMVMPPILAVVPGVLIAGLIRWDPAGVLWPQTAKRRIRPINDFAAELEQGSSQARTARERQTTR